MLESAGAGLTTSRAFLQVAGVTVARHQLALALALECRKILCQARELTSELVALQHAAEAAGAQFHVITAPRQLAGLITAGDEVVVFSDGLLASPQALVPLLEAGPVVLVQPDDTGIPRGFERIDINHAFAGAMRVPGRLVEGLAELPADFDMVSSLTRIALQAGVGQAMVPATAREDMCWALVRDEADAHAVEAGWIEQTLQRDKAATPGAALARLGVRAFGPALLHGGSGGNVVAAGAGAMLVMALVAGRFGFLALALLLVGGAWIARHAAALVMRVEGVKLSRIPRVAIFGWLVDVVLVVLVAWAAAPPPFRTMTDILLAPILFICLLRILPHTFERRWTGWLEDRALVCLLLSLPAAAGLLVEAVNAFALAAGFAGAILAALGARLTRT